MREEVVGQSSRLNDKGVPEAVALEHELRKFISQKNIPGISVCTIDTPLSKETVIVDVNDIDENNQLDNDYHALITCGMNGKFDFHLYESSEYDENSKPLTVDNDLSEDEIKARILEFIEAFKEMVSRATDASGAVMGAVNLEGKQKHLREVLNKMWKQRTIKSRFKNLQECLRRTQKILC